MGLILTFPSVTSHQLQKILTFTFNVTELHPGMLLICTVESKSESALLATIHTQHRRRSSCRLQTRWRPLNARISTVQAKVCASENEQRGKNAIDGCRLIHERCDTRHRKEQMGR